MGSLLETWELKIVIKKSLPPAKPLPNPQQIVFEQTKQLQSQSQEFEKRLQNSVEEQQALASSMKEIKKLLDNKIVQAQTRIEEVDNKFLEALEKTYEKQLDHLNSSMVQAASESERKIEGIRESVEAELEAIKRVEADNMHRIDNVFQEVGSLKTQMREDKEYTEKMLCKMAEEIQENSNSLRLIVNHNTEINAELELWRNRLTAVPESTSAVAVKEGTVTPREASSEFFRVQDTSEGTDDLKREYEARAIIREMKKEFDREREQLKKMFLEASREMIEAKDKAMREREKVWETEREQLFDKQKELHVHLVTMEERIEKEMKHTVRELAQVVEQLRHSTEKDKQKRKISINEIRSQVETLCEFMDTTERALEDEKKSFQGLEKRVKNLEMPPAPPPPSLSSSSSQLYAPPPQEPSAPPSLEEQIRRMSLKKAAYEDLKARKEQQGDMFTSHADLLLSGLQKRFHAIQRNEIEELEESADTADPEGADQEDDDDDAWLYS